MSGSSHIEREEEIFNVYENNPQNIYEDHEATERKILL